MCTLCRGILCSEPLTPIQGVNLLHLHWVMFWYSEMGKGDPWKLKAAIPQGELTIMARVSFQISSIESAAQYAEYQMVRTKLPQIFPFNPLGPTGAHHCPPWALSRVYISHKSVALPNWWPEIFLRYIDFVARQMILVFDAWLKIYVLQQTFMMSLYDDMNCFNTCNVFTKCQTEDLLLSLSLSLSFCCSGNVS